MGHLATKSRLFMSHDRLSPRTELSIHTPQVLSLRGLETDAVLLRRYTVI